MAQCATSNMKEGRSEECRSRRGVIGGERDHKDSSSSELVLMVPGLRSECARRIS